MFVRIAEKIIYGYANIVAAACKALRIGPNALSIFGMLLHFLPATLFVLGKFTAGGLTLVGVVLFDAIDGAVARLTGRSTNFGAFLDSCLDRYSDIIIFSGLLIYTVRSHEGAVRFGAPVIVILSAIAAAYAVSYTRGRAERVLPELKNGYWGRVERLIMLLIGVTLWRGGIALWVLAIFPHITALHRMLLTRKKLRVLDKTGSMQKALDANFGLLLRIIFLDFKRGSIAYDIACAFFITMYVWLPMEWIRWLNERVMALIA